MSCKTIPSVLVCYTLGVSDAFVWKIKDATIDPLGYTVKIGEVSFTATDGNGAIQEGNDVIVTAPVLASDFTEQGSLGGYAVTNTKLAGVYEELKIKADFKNAVDA